MSKHFEKLLKTLKTRQDVTALGFSKEELKSLASDIDENLDSIEETATEEDVENKIKEAIDGVIPMLKLAQMQASRIISKKLKEQDDERKQAEEEKRKAKEEAAKKAAEEAAKKKEEPVKPTEETEKEDEELKSLIKALTEKVTKQEEALSEQSKTISSLLVGNIKEKRRAIVEAKLTGSGKYGIRKKREFERMTFKDDSEFNAYLDEIAEDLEEIKQENAEILAKEKQREADEALAKQQQQPPAPSKEKEQEVEVMSDDEIDSIAENM